MNCHVPTTTVFDGEQKHNRSTTAQNKSKNVPL